MDTAASKEYVTLDHDIKTDNVYLATGFGEWGMTTSFVSAKILSDLIGEKKNKWAELYSPTRIEPAASLKQIGSFLGHVAKGFGSHVMKTENYDYENIKIGEGKVMQFKLKKLQLIKINKEICMSDQPYVRIRVALLILTKQKNLGIARVMVQGLVSTAKF